MSEENAAPIEVITPAADTGAVLSISEAAAAYAAAKAPKKPEAAVAEAPAEPELPEQGDADPAEEPLIGEDDPEADPEAEKHPPIERPKSWTESEQAEWNATPRPLQQKIAARELERDSALRRAQNDAADKLKGVTAKEQQADQARQQYEAKIQSALAVLEREQLRDFSDIKTMADVSRMAAEDPFRKIQWDTHQQELAFAHAENERIKGEKAKASQTERQTRRAEETAKLIEKVPEFADKTKLEAANAAAVKLFRDVGYSDQELASMGEERLLDDHRIQLIINDAMKFRALQAAKVVAVPKSVPQVVRPGTSQPAGARGADRIQALDSKLNNSGDVKDAVALYMAQNANRRRASS